MEVVIDYEFLRGVKGEVIVKELSVAAKVVLHTFHFRNLYPMNPYGSEENGLNWCDGIVPYNLLETALSETVARYAHLYSYGDTKCQFLSGLLDRPVLNLEDFGCPNRHKLGSGYSCVLPRHSFSEISCATRNAHFFYKWLKHHFQTKSYVKCPKEMILHDSMFISAI
jgi:hypothetical protein